MIRVLLVDDEERFREATQALLTERGFDCVAAADAASAKALLKERRFDVVVTDLQVEGNRELEFVRSIGCYEPRPVVILLTAYPTLESAIESVELPVFSYLLKPVPIDKLVERIRLGAAERFDAPGELSHKLEGLTTREREVVELLLAGYRVANISKHLFISHYTVRNHLKSVFSKLGLTSQAELLEKLKPPPAEA